MKSYRFKAVVADSASIEFIVTSNIKIDQLFQELTNSFSLNADIKKGLFFTKKKGKCWDKNSVLYSSSTHPISEIKMRAGKKLLVNLTRGASMGIELQFIENGDSTELKNFKLLSSKVKLTKKILSCLNGDSPKSDKKKTKGKNSLTSNSQKYTKKHSKNKKAETSKKKITKKSNEEIQHGNNNEYLDDYEKFEESTENKKDLDGIVMSSFDGNLNEDFSDYDIEEQLERIAEGIDYDDDDEISENWLDCDEEDIIDDEYEDEFYENRENFSKYMDEEENYY